MLGSAGGSVRDRKERARRQLSGQAEVKGPDFQVCGPFWHRSNSGGFQNFPGLPISLALVLKPKVACLS